MVWFVDECFKKCLKLDYVIYYAETRTLRSDFCYLEFVLMDECCILPTRIMV